MDPIERADEFNGEEVLRTSFVTVTASGLYFSIASWRSASCSGVRSPKGDDLCCGLLSARRFPGAGSPDDGMPLANGGLGSLDMIKLFDCQIEFFLRLTGIFQPE